MNKTITRVTSKWEVTERTHGADCATCDTAEEAAVSHAIVTGSIAAGYTFEYSDATHRAYVERKN